MVSIQSSSYAVSALVSSVTPSANRNADDTKPKTDPTGQTESVRATGNSPPATPVPEAQDTNETTNDSKEALTLLVADDMDDSGETIVTTSEDFEAAARFLLDSIDLREEDEADFSAAQESGISFDEAGTYKPAWIK